jgi:hypothetical protein
MVDEWGTAFLGYFMNGYLPQMIEFIDPIELYMLPSSR